MRRPARLLPALAAILLLPACGPQRAAGPGTASPAPRTQVSGPAVDGVRITAVTIPSASPAPAPSDGLVHGDRLPSDSGVSAAYEVTNDSTQALTYTVLFDFTTSSGEVMSNRRETVRAVGPGRTVRGTVDLGQLAPGASTVTTVKIGEVTEVPADEAPPEAGVCPSSGIRVTADDGDAAMGLRVVGLRLENCGKQDYTLDGYPQLSLLAEDHEPVEGVKILKGGAAIATGTGYDDPPSAFTLAPGETAVSGLVWRNTTDDGTDPVSIPYVRVRAKSGAAPVMLTPHLDLGTTGKLGVGVWKRAQP